MMLRIWLALGISLLSFNAIARDPGGNLKQCLAENTTGKERKELARWVFFAMGAHPEIKAYLTPEARAAQDANNKAIGQLFTRLMVENCARQVQQSVKQGGNGALETAFGGLGTLAMAELMNAPELNQNLMGMHKYADLELIGKVILGIEQPKK